jgi:hypothetical protein
MALAHGGNSAREGGYRMIDGHFASRRQAMLL